MKIDYTELIADSEIFEAFNKSSVSIRNETLSAVYLSIKRGLEKQGSYNKKLHASIFIALCEAVGGQTLYLPRGERLMSIVRDISIFKEFDGTNQKYLSIKHGLCLRSINTILNDQRKSRRLARDCIENLGVGNA